MSRDRISAVLAKYLPETSVEICTTWIMEKNIHLKITRGRATKYGDYMPLPPGKGHRITVNHDLNPYAFLVTFIHEVAHLHCHVQYGRRHEPHGREWKAEFGRLLKDFVTKGIFPQEIASALTDYIRNPSASSCTDHDLARALKKFDVREDDSVKHLEELPEAAVFKLHQSRAGLVFRKGERMRTRFHCFEIKSKRVYFVSALAEVIVVEGNL
jgi:SprT protein